MPDEIPVPDEQDSEAQTAAANLNRANRALRAITAYATILGDDTEADILAGRYDTAIVDLLTDLLHLLDTGNVAEGWGATETMDDFSAITDAAAASFQEEVGERADMKARGDGGRA